MFHPGSNINPQTGEILPGDPILSAFNDSIALVISGRLKMSLAEYLSKIAEGDWAMATAEALAVHAIDALVDSSLIAPAV